MLRKITKADRALLTEWLDNDPHHKDRFTADFWYPLSIAVEDEQGCTMFIKLVPVPPFMRLFVQFCPEPRRVAKAMLKGFPKFLEIVRNTGAKGILFDTGNEKLACFCMKAFGFESVGNSDYRLLL